MILPTSAPPLPEKPNTAQPTDSHSPPVTGAVDSQRRKQLRRELRAHRRSLSRLQQKRAAIALTRQLLQHPQVRRSRHIALYLPNDGEIDPGFFIQVARRLGKTCYLPVLHPVYRNRLWFARFDRDTTLVPNRFGIPEPSGSARTRRPVQSLDLVLLPLVGFDERGGRLGMGGGFYDRTFEFKLRSDRSSAPYLLGLAHDTQRVTELPIAPWDVPLDAVVSDRGIYRFATRETQDPDENSDKPAPFFTRKEAGLFLGRYRLRDSRGGSRRNARRAG